MNEQDELNQLGIESMESHLQSQGPSPRIVEGSLVLRVGTTDLVCHCEVLQAPPGVNDAIVPVGFEVSFGNDGNDGNDSIPRSIRELIVGLSHDRVEAVVQATHIWCEGVFPPIRYAFEPHPDEDDPRVLPFQMSTQNLETNTVADWNLFVGMAQVGGPQKEIFEAFVSEGKIVNLIMNALTTAASEVRLHWIKVYVAIQPDGERVFECKLDNEDWADGVAALKTVRWPRVKGFVQYRQFLMMQPSDTPSDEVRERLEAFAQEQQQQSDPPKKKRASWWPFGR